MSDCLVGKVVVSVMGHDEGKRFLVIREEDAFVYLSDGKSRTMKSPKKKKKKHVEMCEEHISEQMVEKLQSGAVVYDHEVIHALRNANK